MDLKFLKTQPCKGYYADLKTMEMGLGDNDVGLPSDAIWTIDFSFLNHFRKTFHVSYYYSISKCSGTNVKKRQMTF